MGLTLLAVGYGIDVDERTGCKTKYVGVAIAPCFPVMLIAVSILLRRRRAMLGTLHGKQGSRLQLQLGHSLLLAWVDRIPVELPVLQGNSRRNMSRVNDLGYMYDGAAGGACGEVQAQGSVPACDCQRGNP